MAKSAPAALSAMNFPSGSYCPDEGDFIHIDFDPQIGTEQKGKRPALVLSPKSYNAAAKLCVLCPVTNKAKGYPFEVAIPANDDGITGVVLTDQIKSMSWEARGAKYLGDAPDGVVSHVKAKLKALLSIR